MESKNNQIKFIFILFSSFVTTASANNFNHCFEVLNNYSENQIKTIYSYNVENVANTLPANEIFECYLRETRVNNIKSNAEKYFDVFRKCNEFKKQKLLNIDLEHIEELSKMGLPSYLEQRAQNRIVNGEGQANAILKSIQNDLCTKIEMSDLYTEYRSLVRDKLETVGKSGAKSEYRSLVHDKLETVEKSGTKSRAIHSSIVFIVLIHFLFNVF